MKRISILLFFLINASISYSQFANSINYRYQHNPRAEALGRSHTGLEGDINSIIFNPLTTAYFEDLQLSICNSSPFGSDPFSNLAFIALGTKVNKWFRIGLAYRYFRNDYNNNIKEIPYQESATLALGVKLSKHTFLGLGSSYLYSRNLVFGFFESFPSGYQPLGLDNHIGFSGKFFLNNERNFFTTVFKANWQRSIANHFLLSETSAVNFTLGSSLHLFSNQVIFDKYRLFRILSTVEITNDLSEMKDEYEEYAFFKFSLGNELTILDYLSLRLGFVYWNVNFPSDDSLPHRRGFTYGLGFKLPVNEFMNKQRSMNFYFDYCYLPQYFYNNIHPSFPTEKNNFQSISLRMSVALEKIKT